MAAQTDNGAGRPPYKALHNVTTTRSHWRALAVLAVTVSALWAGVLLLTDPQPPPLLVCYYNTGGELQPAALPAQLCTHINVAFARVNNKTLTLDPGQADAIVGVVALKRLHPQLRVLLSVGGAGGDHGFSDMVVDHASRKTFIRSLKAILRDHALDGVDLDWEFPEVHATARRAREARGSRERQHFSQLLREIRAEYARERRPYLLTVAAAAPDPIADVAYDADQLDLYTDWVNLMTYDFHYYSKYTPFTGHNAPLLPRDDEHLYLATLNTNYTAHAWLQRGVSAARLTLGVPAYGHSFTLVSARGAAVGSPARGYGSTGSDGFVSRHEACAFVGAAGARVQRDEQARVPYAWRDTEWVSYEDEASARDKGALTRRLQLRGAMVYALNVDDPRGLCGLGPYPVTRALRAALDGSDH